MKYLCKHLNEIAQGLNAKSSIVLMLDFDGTLAPIVKFPKDAILPVKTKKLLKDLQKKNNLYVGIISGRTLKDLKKRAAIPNIIYAGIHGLEGVIDRKKYTFPVPPEQIKTLSKIKKELDTLTKKFKGLLIEDKKLAIALHFRAANIKSVPSIKRGFKEIIDPFKSSGAIKIIAGKKGYEIFPNVRWNKGHFVNLAIKQISSNNNPYVIVVGDDFTDEDLFRHFQDGLTIKVGKSSYSNAKYYLRNTRDVFTFLQWINQQL